jgi:hypothetical protein
MRFLQWFMGRSTTQRVSLLAAVNHGGKKARIFLWLGSFLLLDVSSET